MERLVRHSADQVRRLRAVLELRSVRRVLAYPDGLEVLGDRLGRRAPAGDALG